MQYNEPNSRNYDMYSELNNTEDNVSNKRMTQTTLDHQFNLKELNTFQQFHRENQTPSMGFT
jgi:hypothetical protein